jgi:hypothetical protein
VWRTIFTIAPLVLLPAFLASVTFWRDQWPSELGELLTLQFYIKIWRPQFRWRDLLSQSAILVLLLAGFYELIDLVVTIYSHLEVWKPPLAAHLGLLVLAASVVMHRWHEWKLRKREARVPEGLKEVIRASKKLAEKQITGEDFLEQLAQSIKDVLEVEREKGAIDISFMVKNKKDELLRIVFAHPKPTPLDETLTLQEGEGGAGLAYQKGVPVYMPSTRHRFGVSVANKEYAPLGLMFKPAQQASPFRSLLCVPVVTGTRKIGVLNFSSRERSAFFPLDFGIAEMAAEYVAIIP